MILTIDIGNSNITIGAYRGNELLFLTRMGTDRTKMNTRLPFILFFACMAITAVIWKVRLFPRWFLPFLPL